MDTLVRSGLTLLVIIALAWTVFVARDNTKVVVVASIVAIALIVGIWLVKKLQIKKESVTASFKPHDIDAAAKRLIELMRKEFDENEMTDIGAETQDLIVVSVQGIQDGQIKNTRNAVEALNTIPPSKIGKIWDRPRLAATLAAFYLLADEQGDDGYNTVTRIDNFIAGIHDPSL